MNRPRLLVVEDDPALLEGLRDILELADYDVTTASHGQQALAEIEKNAPHLIISDVMMPVMDGYQLYTAVRARPEWMDVPFIFLSAKGEKRDIYRGKELGADDYLVKPFDEDDLLVAIRNKLGRRAQLDAVRQRQIADLKHTILATLNHEFRTPLTHIAAYVDVLRETHPELNSVELSNFLDVIQSSSERLQRLVEDFILLAEFQTGEIQQAFEQQREPIIELPMILQVLAERYRRRAAQKQLTLTVEAPGEPLPFVLGDRELLTNALSRLVDNAIKFSHPGDGPINLTARAAGEFVVLQVRDHGPGIPAEELERIFDLFYQVDRVKREQQGTGSGLAIAREIVKIHQGELTARNVLPGVMFTIRLPIIKPS
jgi:two-component system sensor kinase